ncbi:putative entry exclusion protein TrbK-alt [Bradyrhizobium sp. CW7]|uniref:putative entry exclusion protein TrbK-alt n=2 Tax=Bradyrhizobium TaxID=374 RepID=UPI000B5AA3A8|nr:putative entry exclusion protein TrbK-alt [Bradyrhizobium sp. CW7]MCK1413271.1 putative entry exclusion protein TrbK-alt [Bradyrhizobium sp. CW4]MCK1426063.1 putative entry exclusion protein TrbK-alt [Bradyrhizobium sp. 87]MCK1577011.1 putative entry exclusion protein TrbK-alt [Bradyrhizobium sp. 174]MCK1712855.1 putative entry exclusion protein TrbK-alt [Bradyrhizobium sp. 143]UPJ31528.1 putative entry exclusion protein TrbK-alt [Bradyrhizobium sp. CW1]UPJ99910.1 putative entry exclusion 
MDRSDFRRAIAMVALLAVFMVTLSYIHRRPAPRPVSEVPAISAPDDLSAELRRCRALGPEDAEDPHCRAVWEETDHGFQFTATPAHALRSAASHS